MINYRTWLLLLGGALIILGAIYAFARNTLALGAINILFGAFVIIALNQEGTNV